MFTLNNKKPEVFYKKSALASFSIFAENTCVGGSFSLSYTSLGLFNIIKKSVQQRCFSIKIVKFLETSILKK